MTPGKRDLLTAPNDQGKPTSARQPRFKQPTTLAALGRLERLVGRYSSLLSGMCSEISISISGLGISENNQGNRITFF